MPIIRANNIDLYYEEVGPANAPVILLVMGLGTQMIAWPNALIQGLVTKGYRVIHSTTAMSGCRNGWTVHLQATSSGR